MNSLSRVMALLTIAGATSLSFPSGANDSFAEVGAGGIRFVKESRIIMEREELTISRDRVEVSYIFRNPTRSTIIATMAFPVPEYEFNPEYGTPQFDDFSVVVNGKPRPFRKVARALFEGKDVTTEIQAAGLPIEDLKAINGDGEPCLADRIPADKRNQLAAQRLLTQESDYGWWPTWTVSVAFVWDQEFAPQGSVTIRHTYRPVEGADYFYPAGTPDWNWRLWGEPEVSVPAPGGARRSDRPRPICHASRNDLNAALSTQDPERMIFRYWVRYILTTGGNWNGPIRDFVLRVPQAQGQEIVVCSDLPTPAKEAGQLVFRMKDYSPTQELWVCFLQRTP